MKLLVFVLTLLSVKRVFSCIDDLETWIKPCRKDDVQGFQELVKSFLKAVTTGIPKNNVKSLEPVFIKFLILPVARGVKFHFANLIINNLSAVDIYNAVLDTKANTTEIHLNLNLNMTSKLAIELYDETKTIAVGNIKFYLKTNQMPCTTLYGFMVSPNEEGVNYFSVLEDKNKCCIKEDPVITFSPSLTEVLQDPDVSSIKVCFNEDDPSWKNKLTRDISELVIARLIDNFRIACRILPASKYIIDINC